MDKTKYYDWEYLLDRGKNIVDRLHSDWTNKLEDDTLAESCYQEFLATHAGMFMDKELNSLQVISKLALGADYETDFVVVHEGASEGIIYELIEIESPHISAYAKKGQPHSRLTHAVQQIENWRQWMLENRYLFTKMLPNFNKRIIRDSNLRFTIVIGRRELNERFQDEINSLGKRLEINIRSFDYLTDNLDRKKRFFSDRPTIYSSEMENLPPLVANQLANPFHSAISDGDWKSLSRRIKANHHYFALNHDLILEYRKYSELFSQFACQYDADPYERLA